MCYRAPQYATMYAACPPPKKAQLILPMIFTTSHGAECRIHGNLPSNRASIILEQLPWPGPPSHENVACPGAHSAIAVSRSCGTFNAGQLAQSRQHIRLSSAHSLRLSPKGRGRAYCRKEQCCCLCENSAHWRRRPPKAQPAPSFCNHVNLTVCESEPLKHHF